MIDPLEAAIKFFLSLEALEGLDERIGSKYKYGQQDGWALADPALVAILDDSNPDLYVQKLDIRLEVWCLAGTDEAAMDLWLILQDVSRNEERIVVETSKGNALVYSFKPESGPSYLPIQEKGLEIVKRVLSFWRIQVSEVAVSE